MPGRCASARSLSIVDKTLFNFDLEFHSGLFYECGSPDCVWTYQCLASIARQMNSNMAGDELGQAVNSDA